MGRIYVNSILQCVLRGDEAVYWVSMGQQWLVLGGISIRWYHLVIDGTGQYIAILVGAW